MKVWTIENLKLSLTFIVVLALLGLGVVDFLHHEPVIGVGVLALAVGNGFLFLNGIV